MHDMRVQEGKNQGGEQKEIDFLHVARVKFPKVPVDDGRGTHIMPAFLLA
jgi:hypothetical protein